VRLRPGQQGRRIADAQLRRQAGIGLGLHGQLFAGAGAVQLVGAGEVAHQHHLLHLRQGMQALPRGVVVAGSETEPVHARIQLQPYLQRLRQRGAGDGVDLPVRRHRGPQMVTADQFKLALLEEAFQQQDRRADAGFAQGDGLFEEGHGKPVRLRQQRLCAACGAVAVGIGLDHRQCALSAQFASDAVVVAQGGQVDQGTGGTHGKRPEKGTE
jgi:hypothetical protein